jgi:agmatine/peptidylarginine deiminase
MEGMPSAVGNYVNFLRVASLIVVPSYEIDADEVALATVAAIFPQLAVEPHDCRDLAKRGGVLNCCMWTITSPERSNQ